MAEKKTSNKERLREITASIEQGIKKLFEGEKYKNYLSTMSHFPSYSLNNTILIHTQMPDATLVAGYNRWRDQFERHVKKGERGITIIAPTPYKRKVEEQKIDPDTKAPMLDKDGKIIIEEKEIQIAMFKPVKVFDVSQTEGKPLPQLANDLTGDVQQFDAFMEALRRSSPVPIHFEKMEEKMDGYFSYANQSIVLREGMSEVQTVSAAVHEMAHAMLHNYEKERQAASVGEGEAEAPEKKDRNTEEVEAESISYVVCQYYGIQTGENSFGYIAAWSKGKELPELKASLETINKTASDLIKEIDKHFKEVCKERGITLAVSGQSEKESAMEPAIETDQPDTPVTEGAEKENLTEQATEQITDQETEPEKSLTDRIRDMLHQQPSLEETGFSINQGEQYLAIKSCADGYDYTFFDAGFQGQNGGLLERPELPLEEAVRLLLIEEGLEEAKLSASEFETLVENGSLTEQKHRAAATASAIVQNALVHNGLEEEVRVTGIEVYRNLYGDLNPLRYDILVGYEGEILEEDFYDLLQEENHSIGGYPVRVHPVTPRATGPLENYAARLREEHGEKVVWIDTLKTDGQKLDEYPMPDAGLCMDDIEAAGYKEGDLIPLSKDRAMELYDKEFAVYAITDGGDAEMLFEKEEFDSQGEDTVFAVSKEEWEDSPDFHSRILERLEHQPEPEQAFLSYQEDCFAIYQVKEEEGNTQVPLRFQNLDWLKGRGIAVERENYQLVYTGPLTGEGSISQKLEGLYEKFNLRHPADYHSPSLSVSDIIAVKQDGMVSCHYCDSTGFQEIQSFLPAENYLKAAEMAMEDDYGMIDGVINNGPKEQPTVAGLEEQARSGQPISLMDLADAVHREEKDQKKSVVEQLKSKPDQKQKKSAQKRKTEREI